MKNERRQTIELNMLSAYLDNELSAVEQQKLESRLEQEPQLRERLQNLRKTKYLISNLKRHPAPRNFTLTPDMVTVRHGKRKPLFNYLRLASSLAAILLVVLFGVDILSGGLLQGQPQMASEPMMESAAVADETEPEPLIIWAEPGVGGGGGTEEEIQGMGSDGPVVEEPMLEMEPAPPESEVGEAEPPVDSPVTEPETPQEQPEEIFIAEEETGDEKSIILGLNQDQAGEIVSQSQPSDSGQDAQLRGLNPIQWLQIGLAIIAVSGAFVLWFLRRKQLA